MSIDWGKRKTASERASEALEAARAAARAERDRQLAATDWMMLPDAPLSDADRAKVAAYRQALRDAPQATKFERLEVTPPSVVERHRL